MSVAGRCDTDESVGSSPNAVQGEASGDTAECTSKTRTRIDITVTAHAAPGTGDRAKDGGRDRVEALMVGERHEGRLSPLPIT